VPRSTESFGARPDSAAEAASSRDAVFGSSQSFGTQPVMNTQPGADVSFRPGQSFGSPQPPAEFGSQPGTGFAFKPLPASFGSAQPQQDSYFLSKPPAESAQEKTGPIAPVGAAPDSETTGPIRPVRPDGPPGWTLPGT
jgi:hypothetical protein